MGTEQVQPPTPTAQPSVATTDQSQIQPRDMSQQPTPTAPAQPAPQPQAAAPTQPAAATQPQGTQPLMQHAPANPQSSLHARIFDGVLKTLSGGPIKVLQSDPTTGETRQVEVPQSGSKMANSILAGVLSSMFSGVESRQPGYNGPPPSTAPIMGSHGTMHAEEQAKQQALVDQMQDRKMKVLKANLDQMTASMAATRMGDEQMDKQIADGANQVALAKTYDEGQQDPTAPKAIQKTNLTSTEAQQMIQGSKLGWIAVPSGRTSHMDPNTGKVVSEPTYTVLDPHVKVKLTEDEANAMALVNPSWADAWKNSGGNIEVPLDVVNSGRLMRAKVSNVQAALNQFANDPAIAKELGIKGKVGNLMTIAKDPTIRAALAATEQQMAAHAGTDRNYSILDAMLTADGGINLAEKLGIDPMKARTWLNSQHEERTAADAMAKLGGVGPKAIAAPDTVKDVTDTVTNDPTLTDPQKKILLAGLSPNMTNAQLKDIKTQTEAFNKANAAEADNKLRNGGDPKVAAETASNIVDGALGTINIATMRNDAREILSNAVIAEAKKRGLDEANWGPDALENKAKVWQDYHSNDKNKTGSNIGAFRTFLNHADEAETISGEWKRLHSPILDKPMGELEKTGFGGTQFANFQRSLEPVRKEYMSFLNGNRAEHEADIKIMQTVLSDASTPRQVSEALGYLATSADRRLAEVARTYNNTIGTTMPTILSPQAKDVLKRFGVKSMTEPLTADLPKGNGQKISPQQAIIFRDAAGGDMVRAREMAKQAGWIL